MVCVLNCSFKFSTSKLDFTAEFNIIHSSFRIHIIGKRFYTCLLAFELNVFIWPCSLYIFNSTNKFLYTATRHVLCAYGAWPLFLLQSWPAQIRRIDVVYQRKVHLINCFRCFGNRPFPSSPGPLFQNEGRCSAFEKETIFHPHANKTHFRKKGCAPSLILKVRVFGTRKWPIWVDVFKSLCQGQHVCFQIRYRSW